MDTVEIKIIKLDDFGRGIGYYNNKIIFINNAIPDEIVSVKITKDMIDANGHVHNINYIDFATQTMPLEVMQNAKMIEVLYKKEIRDVENIKAFYAKDNEYNYCVIKSEDKQTVHAIIRLS